MGGKVSTPKDIDSAGQLNNNIIIKTMEDHSTQMTILIILAGIICLTGFFQIVLYAYRSHIKNIKKKCNQAQSRNV